MQPKLLVRLWQMNTWVLDFVPLAVVLAVWWVKLSCCGWEDESVAKLTSLTSSPPSPDPMYKATPNISCSSIQCVVIIMRVTIFLETLIS